MPRALLLRAADALTDHPGPTVTRLQRDVAAVLIGLTLTGLGLGHALWERIPKPTRQKEPT